MKQINEEEWFDSDGDCFDDDQDGNLNDFSRLQDHLDKAGAGNDDDDDDDDDDGGDGDDDGDDETLRNQFTYCPDLLTAAVLHILSTY